MEPQRRCRHRDAVNDGNRVRLLPARLRRKRRDDCSKRRDGIGQRLPHVQAHGVIAGRPRQRKTTRSVSSPCAA